MIHKVDHIAIAVKNLEMEKERYRDVLGLTFEGEETLEEQKIRVAFFRCGEITIELMEPTSPDSPIAAFLEKRGGGLHHIAFSTDDLTAELSGLKSKEIRLLNEEPKQGAHDSLIAFAHPKSFGNVLIEFKEESIEPHS